MADSFFTQRRSLDRDSSRLKRASRRLAKKGFRAEAGKMMGASEAARLQEPTIMRPEFRELQQAGRDIAALQAQATSELDFDRDIAPLRGDFFDAVGSSGLSDSERNILVDKFAPEFTKSGLGQLDVESKITANQLAEQSFEGAKMQQETQRRALEVQRDTDAVLGDLSKALEQATTGGTPEEKEERVYKIARSLDPKLLSNPDISKTLQLPLSQIADKRKIEADKSRASLTTLASGQALAGMPEKGRKAFINTLGFNARDAQLLDAGAQSGLLETQAKNRTATQKVVFDEFKSKVTTLQNVRAELNKYSDIFRDEGGVVATLGGPQKAYLKSFVADILHPHLDNLFTEEEATAKKALLGDGSNMDALQEVYTDVKARVENQIAYFGKLLPETPKTDNPNLEPDSNTSTQ